MNRAVAAVVSIAGYSSSNGSSSNGRSSNGSSSNGSSVYHSSLQKRTTATTPIMIVLLIIAITSLSLQSIGTRKWNRSFLKNTVLKDRDGNSREQKDETHLEYDYNGEDQATEETEEGRGEQQIGGSETHSEYGYYNDDKGELVTQLLKSNHMSMKETQHTVLRFHPGTLNITSFETFQYCYCNPNVYKDHLTKFNKISVSAQYQLVYVMVPKSGSSTARLTMKHVFNATEVKANTDRMQGLHHNKDKNFTVFTFVRDPLSRFFSGYDEAFWRSAPWSKLERKHHSVSYLHEGINSNQEYYKLYCPPAIRKELKIKDCNQTYENGTLAERLEHFVSEYDGLSPFNGHLEFQVPKLSNQKTGRPYHLDKIYNTAASEEGWKTLVKNHHASLLRNDNNPNKHTYSNFRKFDIHQISNATKQRICELAMIDYCCLNLPLPPPCSNLHCKLSRHTRNHGDDGQTTISEGLVWQIEPWKFPHQ